MAASGSARSYFRLFFDDPEQPTLIASHNPIIGENIAQCSFTQHFLGLGLAVPQILFRDESYEYLILEDLGDETLFQRLNLGEDEKLLELYKKVVKELLRFQIDGIKGLDLDVAYPTAQFDKRSIMWDLNYFKYYFVKAHDMVFNEDLLESDFEKFTAFLLTADCSYFNYRDFQSRNIMLQNDEPSFIDFQGGRMGPLAYDLVSLLHQAKAALSSEFKERILQFYLEELEKKLPGQSIPFKETYNGFIFFRLMQVLGAYGYRGTIQRKPHFIQSLPFAINSLKALMASTKLPVHLPQLEGILQRISQFTQYESVAIKNNKLKVSINSFSYKKAGIPIDTTENGGGFSFDCRALPNPGRIDEYKKMSGLQKPVSDYLEVKTEVQDFLESAYAIIDISMDNYLQRGFSHLQINFGCTGGQHRSVYCAEQMYAHLREKYPVAELIIKHLETNTWPQ